MPKEKKMAQIGIVAFRQGRHPWSRISELEHQMEQIDKAIESISGAARSAGKSGIRRNLDDVRVRGPLRWKAAEARNSRPAT